MRTFVEPASGFSRSRERDYGEQTNVERLPSFISRDDVFSLTLLISIYKNIEHTFHGIEEKKTIKRKSIDLVENYMIILLYTAVYVVVRRLQWPLSDSDVFVTITILLSLISLLFGCKNSILHPLRTAVVSAREHPKNVNERKENEVHISEWKLRFYVASTFSIPPIGTLQVRKGECDG